MSWIVERLLIDKHRIKRKGDIHSDVFDRLLFLEKRVEELYEEGLISDQEIDILREVQKEKSFSQISREVNLSRSTVTKIFRNACNRIAFYLGGYYTNDGFLERMQEKYNLSDEEIYEVYKKINGRFRHTL